MREEVISSGGTVDPTPAASSAGASSPAVPTNFGSIDGSSHGKGSKAASLSCVGSQTPWTSLSTSAGGSDFGSSRLSCRPWERGDLFRRLATFQPLNWFGKPKIISSLSCAKKGWINIAVDKISCESCGACLSFTSSSSWTSAEAQSASEYFARQLDSGHKVNCPWKGNSCPESLVQFPPTSHSVLIGGYKDRCDGLLQFQNLPVVAMSAIELMRVSFGPQIDRLLYLSQNFVSGEADFKPESMSELENSRDEAYCLYYRAQKLISLCGWEPRWLLNVQDCEEHSAQSARNGPNQTQLHLLQDTGAKAVCAPAKMDYKKNKLSLKESRLDSRSPLLDCSLCGATVRVLDFLTVPRPARFTPNNIDIPDTSKKMGLTRGVSAASGISGWVAADETEKDQTEDRDEVTATNEGKLVPNTDVDLNLTMAGGFPFTPLGKTETSENIRDVDMGRDLMIGQPSGSEIGDRAASYESRGPSSRKRNLEKGGSSDDRPILRLQQQADSVEGTVVDRDGDEVTDGGQDSAGPSKRARDSEIFDTYCSPHQRDSSGAGPSHSVGFEAYADGNRISSLHQGNDRLKGIQSAKDSTRASSVIAMDTVCHGVNDDSMESVENYPGDLDDIHLPSSSTHGNVDINETSELNNSNQVQQSTCFQTAIEVARGDMGVSSTNYGENVNAETVTAQARDGISFGISGGSVGMCASHEAEIHGAEVSVHRTDSVVGDMEPRVEDAENQGQTGEFTPDPGLMDEIVPDEMNREDPNGDNQEMLSHSAGRTDSGSKIGGSTKAESVESGEKISRDSNLPPVNSSHPSHSYNDIVNSGCENAKLDIMKDGKLSFTNNCANPDSEFALANGIGPPKGESNYEEAVEFDPIVHHNQYCPWVNGNVAAAGCFNSSPSASTDAVALCGWQLTLDALDAFRLGNSAIQTGQSESAASLYKDDHQAPGQKLLQHHSLSRTHGQQ